jgi:hypothetical protein
MIAVHDELVDSADQLAVMIAAARKLADSGQVVELDLLAMRIAVLSDTINDLQPETARPIRSKLEALVEGLNGLEYSLRKQNVNLTLDLEQADKRLRAQLAYGAPPPDKIDS